MTCQVAEQRFWLHPLVTCGGEPPNRRARRGLVGLKRHVARRVKKLVRKANGAVGRLSPRLSTQIWRRMARGLVGSVLARAQERYGVAIHAVVVMSSHFHLVVRTPGKRLAAFMRYVDGQLARGVNRLTGKRGSLWGRRYDAQPILDDAAAEARVAYVLNNPVKAALVASPEEWPGINVAYGVGDGEELEFEWLDCTAWHRAGRPANLADFFATATLELTPLPHCAGMAWEEGARVATQWVAAHGAAIDVQRFAGARAVMKRRLRDRAVSKNRRRRPYAFGSAAAVARHRAAMDDVVRTHAVASELWQRGEPGAEFPPGTYPPPVLRPA